MAGIANLLAWFDREASIDPPEEEGGEWQITINEGAEEQLGTRLFERLEEILASANEVEDLVWQDREIFTFTTALDDKNEILRRFREAVAKAR